MTFLRNSLYGIAIMTVVAASGSAETSGVLRRVNVPAGIVVFDDEKTCYASELTITPARAVKELKVGQRVTLDEKTRTLKAGTARLTVSKAANLDMRNIKIVSVDKAKGIVKAQFVATGEPTTFLVTNESLTRPNMRGGETVAVSSMATAVQGKCFCGQKNDGTCWCVKTVTGCCSNPWTDCRCDPDRDTWPRAIW